MCGIFGVVGEPATRPQAASVLAHLKHRGPDDQGVEFFDDGWLAHTRLSIIDLSRLGRQPMVNARGTAWIVCNGEIYNYVELREELHDYPFRSGSDTEVILAAYERWGLACLERLRGMFAFGLWDAERRLLLCATDRFSIKPLYYHFDGQRLVFSSEVKPMAECGVPLRPNAATLYDYLALGLLDHSEDTLFEGIAQLRPGTYLTLQKGRLSVRRYWDLTESGDAGARENGAGDIETRLLGALSLHRRGDVEVGLALSSGLDSHVLKALILREGTARPLQCFTFSFPGTPYDEWERNRQFPAHEDCRYHTIAIRPGELVDNLRTLVEVMEGPVGGLGIYGQWRNAKLAADHNIKVLLDGQGADETFAGYRYYYEHKVRQLWDGGERDGAVEEFRRLNGAHGDAAVDFAAWLAARPPDSLVMAPDSTVLTSSYVHPEFAAAFATRMPVFPAPFTCAVKNSMYRDLFFLKIPKLLRFQDRCAMAWGVEVRVPFLDHPLVEHLFTVPASTLLRNGLTKSLLRVVAQRYLPEEQLRLPKLYVAAPQREWVKTALRGAIEEMIEDSILAAEGYVAKDVLRRQFLDYAASGDLGNSFFVWKFMNLELWYRRFCASGHTPAAHTAR